MSFFSPQPRRKYPALSANLAERLAPIPASHDGNMMYRPCAVRLRDGSELHCVYVVSADLHMRHWAFLPNQTAVSIGSVSPRLLTFGRVRCVSRLVGLTTSTRQVSPAWATAAFAYISETGVAKLIWAATQSISSAYPNARHSLTSCVSSDILDKHPKVTSKSSLTIGASMSIRPETPNQALQRTPRSCHVGSLRSRRAISESSLSLSR